MTTQRNMLDDLDDDWFYEPPPEAVHVLAQLAANYKAFRDAPGRYYVLTYDWDKREYTPQKGVRKGPYTKFGLRKAIRKLREMGYCADRDDNDVLIEKRLIGE